MDCDAIIRPISALVEADLEQLLAPPCVVALKSFVLVHGQWPATSAVQNVGHFDKFDSWLSLCARSALCNYVPW
jgi:hypothetical protein